MAIIPADEWSGWNWNCLPTAQSFWMFLSCPCHPIIINHSVFFCRWVTGRLFLLLLASNCANVCVFAGWSGGAKQKEYEEQTDTKADSTRGGENQTNWHFIHTIGSFYNCFKNLKEALDYQWPNRCSLISFIYYICSLNAQKQIILQF